MVDTPIRIVVTIALAITAVGIVSVLFAGTVAVQILKLCYHLFQQFSPLAVTKESLPGDVTGVYEIIDDCRASLDSVGVWVSNDAAMRLILSGLPGYNLSLESASPWFLEDVVEESFLNAQEWHLLQKLMVHGITTLLLIRSTWLILNPAMRRRHLSITRERYFCCSLRSILNIFRRPVSVVLSWLCVASAGVLFRYAEVALGGWAAIIATAGLVLQLDLSYTRIPSSNGGGTSHYPTSQSFDLSD
eukprot:m.144987 g.144987  ORF g.144987 m.144987 type:complete len:246 (+) comp14934_c0_seq2:316-1053(+)